ncbi:putative MNN4-regulates the mannosylphosphorylation [Fusarium proliferatum ET1]|uniref:Probable MNN4-regulates the mannosylphosphorylation n=1 Tax=Fusarium proliferatum (strain ET1) TaxID=1227346 RepID=A0A1L7VU59_FUSPR|nr:putative MNN4-regulates the mannosylphosphorylation [Fusarium proliferatum ET1]CZR43616.1 probable MNN4-regulates the mannosylphosphorylation [Fusarium proliferatum ET1]
MFRTSSRSLWGVTSRASSIRASQFLPRASIAPLLRQQRAVYSSKSDDENAPPPPKQPIDIEAERKRGQELLQSNPSVVSSKSSVANAASTAQGSKSADQDMTSELKHDIDVVKDTFTFTDVPRESSVLGLAGTLPYLGTSLSTVFLAWDLNKPIPTGNSFYDAIMIDHETAKYLLSVIEPLQLGYGAVIISFLGAIHWGLEYAEKQPLRERTRFRYGMGLAASIVAWPTLMLPVEYALTSQFMAFVALYFADSRAATKGWAPRWYGSYRFLLTAMVGFAIFISLIGRAKIKQGDAITAKGLSDNFARSGIADHDTNWEKLEAEEKARRRKQKEEEKKAKEAEKKKKEEEKKGKKKGGEGGDKAKKRDDKNNASEEGDKKNEEKSEDNSDNAEKKEGGKDSESKDEGDSKDEKKESDSKDESKDEDKKSESDEDSKGDKDKEPEESPDEESKDDSKQDSDKKDDKQDKSEDKKENKSDEKKDDKSKGKKDKKE